MYACVRARPRIAVELFVSNGSFDGQWCTAEREQKPPGIIAGLFSFSDSKLHVVGLLFFFYCM